jgi:hypothetical protein
MERVISTCGLICSECEAYKATQRGDEAALKEVAEAWSKQYGAVLTAEDCSCNGCRASAGPWMSHCFECEYRICGIEQGVANCAQCSSYACEKLSRFFEQVPDAKATLDGLRIDE